jgi:putative ABC transport system ATP-binding protein
LIVNDAPALRIEELRKTFRSPTGSLSDEFGLYVPEFRLAAGEQAAMEGRSGTGKTTFLHLIAGILRADSGRVLVAGEDIVAMSESRRDRHRGRHIGYVFQTFNLLSGYTALENVLLGMMFGRGADRDAAVDLLESLGLGDRMNHRPRQLSVGQRQRVALARALANEPELVLADEPTGNLDAVHASEALAMIRQTCDERGAALLLVSHDREVLASFDRVDRLEDVNQGVAT